jgi:hypothetical protein
VDDHGSLLTVSLLAPTLWFNASVVAFIDALYWNFEIYEIEIDKLTSPFAALSGQTQHIFPYVVGTKEMTSYAH